MPSTPPTRCETPIARPGWLAVLIAAALFAAVAPTLTWLEFSSGSENLLAATVLEMHAGGPWAVPNLNGEPRVRKPPLPAWVAALFVPADVVAQLDSTERVVRDKAYRRLAWSLRWPALLLGCLIALATYEMGRTLVDARHGLIACAVCASSLLLLRYGRSATSDIHLAFWVTLTNLCLIKWCFAGRHAAWLPLAGAAAGMAFMSKGPVGLIQSAFPFVTFELVRRWFASSNCGKEGPDATSDRAAAAGDNNGPKSSQLIAIASGIGMFLLLAMPWFAHVFHTIPDVWRLWRIEVLRDGATTLRADPPFTYFVVFPMLLPWIVFLIAGAIACARRWRGSPAMHCSLLLLVLPLIVMSLVKDKNERYLLPMTSAAALVTAFAVVPQLNRPAEQSRVDRLLRPLHMVVLLAIAVGLPVAGAVASSKPGGEAWWGWGFASAAAGVMALIPMALHFLYPRRRWSFIVPTAGLMLLAHALFLHGYRSSMNGRSEMRAFAESIRQQRPAAEVFYVDRRASPKAIPQDLQIYLNRVVRTIYGPQADLPDPAPGRVLVMLQRENEPPPALAGWRSLAAHALGQRTWHALTPE